MEESDLTRELALAKKAARVAGEILRSYWKREGLKVGSKGHDNPVTAADLEADQAIKKLLRDPFPAYGWLSEETADNDDRLKCRRVWIVDPLDGTREYGEKRNDWAVHIALSIGGKPEIGAVALPGLGQVLVSEPQALPPVPERLRVLVSRTRPAKEAVAVAQALGAELVPMGSAGAKAMEVLRGGAEIYLHTGGQYEWDNCAPAAVALAAGLHASRADGSPLTYNHENPYLPDLLICQKELAPKVLAALEEVLF